MLIMRYNNRFEHLSGQTSRLQNLKANKIMEHSLFFTRQTTTTARRLV